MKRVLALLVGAGIAVGGSAAAWAGTNGGDGTKREAAKACLAQARQEAPDASKADLKDAVKTCLSAAGIQPRTLTAEQQAKRDAVKACLQGVKSSNPGADKATLRQAAAKCLQDAGVMPGRLRARISGLHQCVTDTKAANPTADRATLRTLVKECVQSK